MRIISFAILLLFFVHAHGQSTQRDSISNFPVDFGFEFTISGFSKQMKIKDVVIQRRMKLSLPFGKKKQYAAFSEFSSDNLSAYPSFGASMSLLNLRKFIAGCKLSVFAIMSRSRHYYAFSGYNFGCYAGVHLHRNISLFTSAGMAKTIFKPAAWFPAYKFTPEFTIGFLFRPENLRFFNDNIN